MTTDWTWITTTGTVALMVVLGALGIYAARGKPNVQRTGKA